MFLDAQGRLSDSQVATTNATTPTTNSVDLGNVTPKRDIGMGEPMAVVFVPESVVAAADTFTFELITATNDALSAGVKGLIRTPVLTRAQILAAKLVVLPVPPGRVDQRYFGARYTLGAADGLTVSAYLLPLNFIQMLKDYASAIVID